jgi:CMP-N-acetylneuraminic acid synthetase
MINGEKVLALIPARGGSKRLPGKNTRLLNGKPLLAWTVQVALASRYIDSIVVSTDDEGIAQVARDAGAEAPFIRPELLASDQATSEDVALHALAWLEGHGNAFPILILLQPTSPLRTREDADVALEMLVATSEAQAVVSVTRPRERTEWLLGQDDRGFVTRTMADELPGDPACVPMKVLPNGAVFAIWVKELRAQNTFLPPRTLAYVMPPSRSIDVDDEYDWLLASLLIGGVS